MNLTAKLFVSGFECRHFGLAWSAPACPKVKHHGFSFEVREINLFSEFVVDGKIRGLCKFIILIFFLFFCNAVGSISVTESGVEHGSTYEYANKGN